MTEPVTFEQLYRDSRAAICTLVTPENESTTVPACPAWTLHDLVAHLTGLLDDFATGNTVDAGSEAWTAAQVERFRETDLTTLIDIWREVTDRACAKLYPLGKNYLGDIVTHEFDIRGAVGNTDERDSARLVAAVEQFITWTDERFRRLNMPPLEIRFDGKSFTIGDGEPQAAVRASLFELSRVISGRRSTAQVRALDWSGDPTFWLDEFAPFGNRETDLVE